jgi:glutaredoxin
VDKEGILRYVDVHDIDEQPDNEELFTVLRELEPDVVIPQKAVEAGPQPVLAKGGPRSVVLYCRPGCIDCRLARRFLEREGIAYTEINVRADAEAERKVRGWTGGALVSPVFDIDGTIVIDFKRSELMSVLGLV